MLQVAELVGAAGRGSTAELLQHVQPLAQLLQQQQQPTSAAEATDDAWDFTGLINTERLPSWERYATLRCYQLHQLTLRWSKPVQAWCLSAQRHAAQT